MRCHFCFLLLSSSKYNNNDNDNDNNNSLDVSRFFFFCTLFASSIKQCKRSFDGYYYSGVAETCARNIPSFLSVFEKN